MRTDTLKFFLEAGNGNFQAFPVYSDSVAIDINRESEQQFYRRKFNGKLIFTGTDYDNIMAAAFDYRISILIELVNFPEEGDLFMDDPFVGYFYKADCTIDEGKKTIEVTPSTDDAYTPILDGWEKEFNLTKLAPEIVPIDMMRRPVIQVYSTGQPKVSCILSQMVWEQDCEPEDDPSLYGFQSMPYTGSSQYIYSVFQKEAFDWGTMPPVPSIFYFDINTEQSAVRDGYYIDRTNGQFFIRRSGDDRIIWSRVSGTASAYPFEVEMRVNEELYPDLAGERLVVQGRNAELWMRILCDVDEIMGSPTSALRTDDFVGYIAGYHRYLPLSLGGFGEVFTIQETMSTTPTEWGISESGKYYVQPVFSALAGYGKILPICKGVWDEFSLWWLSNGVPLDELIEVQGRKPMTLRDAYPLHSVISVLLNEIGAGVTFSNDASYSEFFYGTAAASIRGNDDTNLFITPKSNLVAVDYDNAAQRGEITLKAVFEMLRDVYRCFWFIDNGKLRIEHIAYFMRGGNYLGPMGVGIDLTDLYYSRTGKAVAEGQMEYKFDKPETYERIEFGWMDDVTAPFDGFPIEILSGYVVKGKKNDVTLSKFTSDIDYIFLNPEGISKDGFALIGAHEVAGVWKVPFVDFYDIDPDNPTPQYVLQNGYLAFMWLTRYYMYDLCAPNYSIDGVSGVAVSTMPLKAQEVTFPAPVVFPTQWIPDTMKLVKTFIGSGRISKMTINLTDLTVKATLNYAS